MKLDFSEYHPLDHSLWECWGYPGGRRRHLSHWWRFKARKRMTLAWRHATGRHVWRAYASRLPGTNEWHYGADCAGCPAEPDPNTAARLIANMKKRKLPDLDFDIEEEK